jgi:hypothetical protein
MAARADRDGSAVGERFDGRKVAATDGAHQSDRPPFETSESPAVAARHDRTVGESSDPIQALDGEDVD